MAKVFQSYGAAKNIFARFLSKKCKQYSGIFCYFPLKKGITALLFFGFF